MVDVPAFRRLGFAGALRSKNIVTFIVVASPAFLLGALLIAYAGFDYWAYRETSTRGTVAKARAHLLVARDNAITTEISWVNSSGTQRSVTMALSRSYVLSQKARLASDGVIIKYLPDISAARPIVVGDEDEAMSLITGLMKFGAVTILVGFVLGIIGVIVGRLISRLGVRAMDRREIKQAQSRLDESRRLVESLPFETLTVPASEAMATWERMKSEARGYPVMLGSETDVANLLQSNGWKHPVEIRRIMAILERARQLYHPGDLQAKQRADAMEANDYIRRAAARNARFPVPEVIIVDAQGNRGRQPDDETRASLLRGVEEDQPPVGEWPEHVESTRGLAVASGIVFQEQDGRSSYAIRSKERIVVARLPVSHAYEVPGYLLFGNWNACPPAEYHVAALRSWSARYGAEIVGMMHDTIDIRVSHRPATRAEALELAREHYIYCNDVIDQGYGTLSNLAAQLMQDDLWSFWWD